MYTYTHTYTDTNGLDTGGKLYGARTSHTLTQRHTHSNANNASELALFDITGLLLNEVPLCV